MSERQDVTISSIVEMLRRIDDGVRAIDEWKRNHVIVAHPEDAPRLEGLGVEVIASRYLEPHTMLIINRKGPEIPPPFPPQEEQ